MVSTGPPRVVRVSVAGLWRGVRKLVRPWFWSSRGSGTGGSCRRGPADGAGGERSGVKAGNRRNAVLEGGSAGALTALSGPGMVARWVPGVPGRWLFLLPPSPFRLPPGGRVHSSGRLRLACISGAAQQLTTVPALGKRGPRVGGRSPRARGVRTGRTGGFLAMGDFSGGSLDLPEK